ncbi:MAG TPA: phospholipase C, phosphocholine-specific [Terracidiphilus sp.]|nr:phospholipase C, phosphocholine-specific [Terracidiphilus sp.]
MQTRRDFLKLAAMLSGASAVSGFVPDSVKRAYAIAPESGSTFLDADHIVILMQENRSFDHALGTLRGVRGFNDPRAIRLPNGNSVFVQTDAKGASYAPWRLDIKDTRITWMGSIPHSRNSQVDAWNEGRYDGWLDAKRSHNPEYSSVPMTMGHYTREDLPFYYALADAFTVCDQNYCGVMTSTTPNRSTFWTGTVRDRQSRDSKVYMRNDQFARLRMPWKTYPERLLEAGVSWKFYQNEMTYSGLTGDHDAWLGNFGCNLLEFFAAYNIEAYPGFPLALQAEIASLTGQIAKLQDEAAETSEPEKASDLQARIDSAKNRIAKLQAQIPGTGAALYGQLTDAQRALHQAAFVTNAGSPEFHELEQLPFTDDGKPETMVVPKGDIFYQFRKDVIEGNLPTISWLTAPEKFSDHPTSPWYGAWYVSEVMDILTKNPNVWKKTIFILTYDENDGYFDHAPSFVAADPKRPETGGASAGIDTGIEYSYAEDELAQGVSQKEARSGPIGLGFRVPMIIASPWTRGGWVNSQLFDHTSTLMFLENFIEKKYGKTVKEENISAWRRAVAGDLTSVFRRYDGIEQALDFLDRDKFVIGIEQARYKEVPSSYRKLAATEIDEINRNLQKSSLTSHQEPGTRPACALPYELRADGGLTPDGTQYELRLTAGDSVHGKNAAGAPFNVYLRNLNETIGGGFQAATYAVKAGDTLTPRFPVSQFADSKYSVEVHAPNGFYRSFTGAADSQHLQIHIEYEKKGAKLTGNVIVHMRNTSSEILSASVADNSYGTGTVRKTLSPGDAAQIVLRVKKSQGWYDFTVKVDGSDAEAHYAGRVETGRPSLSDPLLAGTV